MYNILITYKAIYLMKDRNTHSWDGNVKSGELSIMGEKKNENVLIRNRETQRIFLKVKTRVILPL